MNFSDLGLSASILQAVEEAGYTKPTPIQEQAIPYILMNRDVLGCAQTGTGKTAGFTLPMIEILSRGRPKARMPRSLIIEPTRELAAQVAENFEKYGKHNKLSMALLIGGSSFADQEKALDRGVDVLIATPGRLIDLFERGKILLADVKVLVIDEADRMLDMGFIPDVERIVSLLPTIRQTLFFSATMPPEIRRLADRFLMNPKEVSVTPPASPAENVQQSMIKVDGRKKREALANAIAGEDVKSALIFCNRKRDVDTLRTDMKKRGYNAAALHGDMVQASRTETLEKFRKGEIQFLVCSDVAARGLDIPAVSHVFNFDVPGNPEDYIHRIGRTGRAGRSGKALTLVTSSDMKQLDGIQKLIGRKVPVEGAPEPAAAEKSPPAKADESKSKSKSQEAAAKPESGEKPSAGEKKAGADADKADADKGKKAGRSNAKGDKNAKDKDAKDKDAKAKGKDGKRGGKQSSGKDEERSPRRPVTKPFGEDTPAFLLRPVKAAANA